MSDDNLRTKEDFDAVFMALQQSRFRSRFRLQGKEQEYLRTKGLALVLTHASEFIEKRLAPALPVKDGKQTPWRGHPVFLAQHATATCCRGCLEKWHGIPRGRELSQSEQSYVVSVVERWLREQEDQDCTDSSAG